MRVSAETKTATRERILEVAQGLFAEKGYEATATRDIAQAAGIATGTLFNYFATKEAIVTLLVDQALEHAANEFGARADAAASFDEDLFAYVAAGLRPLKPFRKYLTPILETTLCPLANTGTSEAGETIRVKHLETVTRLATQHGLGEVLSPVALQMYWTLYTGVLAFWANDRSPKQEDTLALLDQSVDMFARWLRSQASAVKSESRRK